MKICLYGASSATLDDIYYENAYELGKKMAERGHSLVFGGGATGLMGSCVRGVYENGGESIGVSPKFFDMPGILFQDCTELIFTETMRERKAIMEEKADCFLIVPGGVGTFEEFFETITLKQLGQLNKPVAIFNINHYYDKLIELMDNALREGFMKVELSNVYGVFTDIDEMLTYLETVKEEPLSVHKLKG